MGWFSINYGVLVVDCTSLSLGDRSFVMISDLALFIFPLLYNVASEVSPTWLTPVYL